MTRLSDRKVLYFIAGTTPSTTEAAEIARIEGKVYVRSAAKTTTYGTALESCDAVAGQVPTAYSAITRATVADGGGMRGVQLVANRCGLAGGSRVGSTGGRSDVQMVVRRKHFICGQDVKDLQIGFSYFNLLGGTGENLPGNDGTIEANFEITTPVAASIPTFFNGAKVAPLANGMPLLLSAPNSGIDVAADGNIWTRLNMLLPNTSGTFVTAVSVGNGISGESGAIAPTGSASVMDSTGTISTPPGGTGYSGIAPTVILGKPKLPVVAIILNGDSIMAGNNDVMDSTTGAITMYERGLVSVNGHAVPWLQNSVGSHTMQKCRLDNNHRARSAWQYCSHFLNQLGTNDISAQTVAQMQTWYTELWTAAKRTISNVTGQPLHVTQNLILPRNTAAKWKLKTATIAAGGTGYANNATFDVTIAGGTQTGGASTVNVTTNGSGVVTTVNSISNPGEYTVKPSLTNSPTGGAGSGLSLTLVFGSFYNPGSMTVNAGFEVGGKRDQLNAWFKTQVGNGILDAVIDTSTNCLEDPANPSYYLTDGVTLDKYTIDGVHPEPAGHLLGVPIINAWAATLTV